MDYTITVKYVALVAEVVRVYKVGPKRVARVGGRAAIYLPKGLEWLQGRTVFLTIEVMGEENEQGKDA